MGMDFGSSTRLMTTNAMGDIISGTLIKLPEDDATYMVGEIYSNGLCKLYNEQTMKFKGLYNLLDIKPYVR